jgi:hypothetical protein
MGLIRLHLRGDSMAKPFPLRYKTPLGAIESAK